VAVIPGKKRRGASSLAGRGSRTLGAQHFNYTIWATAEPPRWDFPVFRVRFDQAPALHRGFPGSRRPPGREDRGFYREFTEQWARQFGPALENRADSVGVIATAPSTSAAGRRTRDSRTARETASALRFHDGGNNRVVPSF